MRIIKVIFFYHKLFLVTLIKNKLKNKIIQKILFPEVFLDKI